MDGSGFPARSPSPGTTVLLFSASGIQQGKGNGKGEKCLWVNVKQSDTTTMHEGNAGEVGDYCRFWRLLQAEKVLTSWFPGSRF